MTEENEMPKEENVYLNNKEITKEELQQEQSKNNVRIIQEDDNHYRKLERMKG